MYFHIAQPFPEPTKYIMVRHWCHDEQNGFILSSTPAGVAGIWRAYTKKYQGHTREVKKIQVVTVGEPLPLLHLEAIDRIKYKQMVHEFQSWYCQIAFDGVKAGLGTLGTDLIQICSNWEPEEYHSCDLCWDSYGLILSPDIDWDTMYERYKNLMPPEKAYGPKKNKEVLAVGDPNASPLGLQVMAYSPGHHSRGVNILDVDPDPEKFAQEHCQGQAHFFFREHPDQSLVVETKQAIAQIEADLKKKVKKENNTFELQRKKQKMAEEEKILKDRIIFEQITVLHKGEM